MIIKPRYNGPQLPTEYAVRVTSAAPNGITVADDADIDMGTNNFGIALKRKLADWAPAVDTILLHKHDGSNGIIVTLLTTGIIRLTINLTNYDASVATGLAANANEWAVLSVVRESASVAGSVTRYIAGSVLDAASAITAGTPTTVNNASAMYIDGDSGEGFDVDDAGTILLNFAPTAAEVATLCTTGIPESWKWGSQTALYASDFSAGTDGWTAATGGTIDGNIDGINGSDNWCRIQRTSTTGVIRGERAVTSGSGKKYATITLFIPAGSPVTHVRLVQSTESVSVLPAVIALTPNVEKTVTVYYETTIAKARIVVNPCDSEGVSSNVASGNPVYFKAVFYYEAGATFAALPETIPTSGALAWTDSSGNTGGGTLPAAGATKVTIRK